ncbi:hypothetical protein SAMN05216352_102155 [Alteribacillus bidgolensis]|uniref:Uncharacterized protein n=1 Tax=Alteribacillus bidgolensis TaxID=930129 RepID=A0A1G8EBL6_9BACI|nr:hypothetical protein SAMN05216352_102155 [Alteribacillus bidgolensis]
MDQKMGRVKQGLYDFYQLVEESGIKEFIKAIETLKTWQTEMDE